MVLALCWVGAFLLGSIPPGLVIAKMRGVDLRNVGSRNIGTTNVLRTVGKTEAALTLVLDLAKGFAPVVLVAPVFRMLGMDIPVLAPFAAYDKLIVAQGLVGMAAIFGHNFFDFSRIQGRQRSGNKYRRCLWAFALCWPDDRDHLALHLLEDKNIVNGRPCCLCRTSRHHVFL